MELRDALNTIWEVASPQLTTLQEIKGVVKDRIWSFALVLTIGSVLTGLLLLTTWISAIGTLYAFPLPYYQVALHILNSVLSFAAVTALFAATYKIVPEVVIEWRDVILGAAVTSIFFTLGNLLLGLYLGKASFSSTYGAAGSTIVLAVWVYYSSQIFFLGAEFTKAFTNLCGSGPAKSSHPLITPASGSPSPASPPSLITPADAH
jgi:membrane protein